MPLAATLGAEFLRENLGMVTRELRFQARFYLCWSCGLVAIGIVIILVALIVDDRLVAALLGTGGTLVGSVTVFPLATIFATRRKLTILSSYERELSGPAPPEEAVDAVKKFLERQLNE